MTGEPFDTVDGIKEWLEEEEPDQEEAEEALQVETDNANRTTGKMAISEYLDSFPEEEEDQEDETPEGEQKYVVLRPFAGNSRGDKIYRDPKNETTRVYVRDGRIQRRPN